MNEVTGILLVWPGDFRLHWDKYHAVKKLLHQLPIAAWRKNAAGTTLTCTISGASATSCNDLTHNFTVAQGDLLDIQAVTTGTIVGTPTVIMGTQFGIAAAGSYAGYTAQTAYTSSTRAIGTIYHNTLSVPLLVSLNVNLNNSSAAVFSDSSSSPTTVVAVGFAASSVNDNMTFAVLPGNYYQLSIGSGTVTWVNWVEWH